MYSRAVALTENRTSGRGVVKATERGRELSHIVALQTVPPSQGPMGGGDGGGLRGCPLRCAKSYRIGVKAPLDRIDGVETCRVDDGQVAGLQRWVEPDELVFCVSVS